MDEKQEEGLDMDKECLVIVPAYNEENNILHVLEGIKRQAPEVDVIVIDDCSQDRTASIVRTNGYNIISLCANLGYSGAILTGIKYAMAKNYKYVLQFDGDGQHDPGDISKLIEAIEDNHADIVIGSRFMKKSQYQHGFAKTLGTKMLKTIIRFATGKTITDPTSGLQLLNRRAYRYYAVSGNYPEYPDANILILMLLLGFNIDEIPVTMHERRSGIGMHDSLVKSIKYMISMLYSILISLLKGSRIGSEVKKIGL